MMPQAQNNKMISANAKIWAKETSVHTIYKQFWTMITTVMLSIEKLALLFS